jgi:conjugative element/phage-associated large polyvalent protein
MFGINTIGPADPEDRQPLFRKKQQASDPPSIAKTYYVQSGALGVTRYYDSFKMKKEELAITAKPNSISSTRDDKQTIGAMLDLAQACGWNTIRIRGSKDFTAEAWVQARMRGIEVEGYKPTQPQKQEAARRMGAQAAPRTSAPVQPKQAPAASRQQAPEPKQAQQNVFGKVETLGRQKRAQSSAQAPSQRAAAAQGA